MMCNLYSITTNQAAIIALFRVINRHVGNLPPMPGVFPGCRASVVRDASAEREMRMMRWGCHRHQSWRGHRAKMIPIRIRASDQHPVLNWDAQYHKTSDKPVAH